MIALSKIAKDYLSSVDRKELMRGIDIGESQLSAIVNGTVEPSKSFIEKFLLYTHMDFEKSFEVREDK